MSLSKLTRQSGQKLKKQNVSDAVPAQVGVQLRLAV